MLCLLCRVATVLLAATPLCAAGALQPAVVQPAATEPPDVIVHHGKIVTVDGQFRIAEAMALRGDRIQAVGESAAILKLAGPKTRTIDLAGRTVLPGLCDSHAHPQMASVYEFDHTIPNMETIEDVLSYVRARAEAIPPGRWIVIQQVFITRLREKRFPTRQELDAAAPRHPVCFRTGPDAALNSLALEACGIDRTFKITDGQPGFVEHDAATGEPTGMLRSCARFIKAQTGQKTPGPEDRYAALKKTLAAYNAVGITSIVDRYLDDAQIELYQRLHQRGELSCRAMLYLAVDGQAPLAEVEKQVARAARHPLHVYNNMLWLKGIKFFLDGGMLTGSAYMLKPWGVSKIYSITDSEYRGMLFLPPDRLRELVRVILAAGFQPSAHTVGDGAVKALADAYESLAAQLPVHELRPCISHANFMSPESIVKMSRLGIVADLQPVWIYLDGATLTDHFGAERLTWFQPYRTLFERGVIVGGGSDHMQKIGRHRAINPYDPFLGIWTTLVRRPRWTDRPMHPEHRITREQAIRLYTIHNAYLTFEEEEKGSIEPGKLADFIVLDRDILTCDVDAVKDIEVLATWLGGKEVRLARDAR